MVNRPNRSLIPFEDLPGELIDEAGVSQYPRLLWATYQHGEGCQATWSADVKQPAVRVDESGGIPDGSVEPLVSPVTFEVSNNNLGWCQDILCK